MSLPNTDFRVQLGWRVKELCSCYSLTWVAGWNRARLTRR